MKNSGVTAQTPDIAIIGGGIVGMWCAYLALKRGASVALFEQKKIGSGASGGILGALMPHQPINWNEKKQFQLEGLLRLPTLVETLEAETGLSCGYRQCGRVMPIDHVDKRRQSHAWSDGAKRHWPEKYSWNVLDQLPEPEIVAKNVGKQGFNQDDLSAHINPRALLAALEKQVAALSPETLGIGVKVVDMSTDASITTDHGARIAPGKAIFCAGVDGFDLLTQLWPAHNCCGVKGQAALLRPSQPVDPAMPILYDNGTYVIAHENGLVAVGSTSENDFDDPVSTDAQLDAVIARATALCPLLAGADIVERWASVRPRAGGRNPLVGFVPSAKNTIIATGGFKITYAIAHLMAEAALDLALLGKASNLPTAFMPVRTP